MTLLHAGDAVLPDDDVARWLRGQLEGAGLEGRSVLLLVPDGTRTAPVPLVFESVHRVCAAAGARLTVLVALGTHQPMSDDALSDLLGADVGDLRAAGVEVLNHAWHDPDAFADLGTIGADEVAALSGGLLAEPVDVRVNRLVVESDVVLIAGPVFPHEVVGFSGGNKYLFPGVGGQEVIDLSHWLGALLTSYALIGTPGTTPVRALIDRAAALVPTRRLCLALVVQDGVRAVAFGTPEQAWAQAAEVSARVHVRYLDRAYPRVLALVPTMYPDMWTAAKGMYKLEPVVADGGTLVLYAPHVVDFSVTHGEVLAQVGYHVRDYFVGQEDRFAGLPRGVLAHSTHLRGVGTWDAATGEHPRIDVVLATGISAERCAAHALGYLEPRAVDPEVWACDPDTLVVPHAGELLHRLA